MYTIEWHHSEILGREVLMVLRLLVENSGNWQLAAVETKLGLNIAWSIEQFYRLYKKTWPYDIFELITASLETDRRTPQHTSLNKSCLNMKR
jgi:hypothetical protein